MDRVGLYFHAKERLEKLADVYGISQEKLETKYYKPKPDRGYGSDINNYFYLFCEHLADRQYMSNIIKFSEMINIFEDVFKFDPKTTLKKYDNADQLLHAVQEAMECKTLDNIDKWKEYITGIYQCAQYLSKKNSKINTDAELDTLIDKQNDMLNDKSELKRKLHDLRHLTKMSGVGSAVCYNWLKECGAEWLAKPDLHIKRIIAELLKTEMDKAYYENIDDEYMHKYKDTEYSNKIIGAYFNYKIQTEPDMRKISDNNKEKLTIEEFCVIYMYEWAQDIKKSGKDDTITPFKLDRILYLYCTKGYFYADNDSQKCISKQNLIDQINSDEKQ